MKARHRNPADHNSSVQREYTIVSGQVIYFLQQDIPLKGHITFPKRAAGLEPHAKTSMFVTDILFSNYNTYLLFVSHMEIFLIFVIFFLYSLLYLVTILPH